MPELSKTKQLSGIQAFQLNARVENYSPKTLRIYNYIFDSIKKFVGDIPIEKADVNTLRQYFIYLQEKNLSPATRSLHYRHLKHFYNFLIDEGFMSENPLRKIKKPRTAKTLPRTLDNDEIKSLLGACNKKAFTGFRNYCMIMLFLDSGIRLGECRNLQIQQLDLDNRSIKILGKGNKERYVFMGTKTLKILKKYLNWRNSGSATDYVFISTHNTKLTERNVQHIFERLCRKARINRISPHMLRHTFSTNYIKNGGDAFTLQRILGHADITTTMIYVNMAGKDLKEAHRRFSPIDQLNI